MTGDGREAVIDFEFLRGLQNQTIIKDLCVANAAASETLRFKSPYRMVKRGSSEDVQNWADVHIAYKELHTVFPEAVAGSAHLYAYGVSKCTFLAGLTGQPMHNLEDRECPPPVSFNHKRWCKLQCDKFPKFACATKTAHSLYVWLMY